jgi:hypothetical protein
MSTDKPMASASMREDGTFQLMARHAGRALLVRSPEYRVFDIAEKNSEASLFISEAQARAIYADLHAMFGDGP